MSQFQILKLKKFSKSLGDILLNTNISTSATHIILQFDKTILKKEIVPQNQTDVIARFSDRQLLTIVPSRCRLLWGIHILRYAQSYKKNKKSFLDPEYLQMRLSFSITEWAQRFQKRVQDSSYLLEIRHPILG